MLLSCDSLSLASAFLNKIGHTISVLFIMTTNQDIEKLEASQPFLGDSGSNCSDEQQPQSSIPIRRKQNSLFLKRYGVLMHILLIASYSIAFWYAGWKWKLSSRPGELLPLPAREAVHWELRPFTTSLIDNPFTGEPRPELEHAWHNLVSSKRYWF